MDRTLRAALLAALIGGGSVAFFGFFLGFAANGATGVIVTAVVVGLLAGGLLLGASRRADTFTASPPGDDRDPR